MVTNVLSMVTDVLPMVTNVYPKVAKESSVANPQKVAKIDKKSEKWIKMSWQHCLCRRITRLSVKFIKLVVISAIDWLSGTIVGIGGVPYKFLVTNSNDCNGDLMTSAADPNFQIEPYHHQLPLVTECPRIIYFQWKFFKISNLGN